MTNARLRRIGKERAIEIEESGEYQEERDYAFNEALKDFLHDIKDVVTEDDLQGFIDSFTFPDEDEWIADKVESEYGDYCDQAYEEYKDKQMGID